MPTEIKAIETHYAGCRFRSRLEARWAVFFDALGVEWEYEPQGYETAGGRYLPDFWLPEPEIFVEVKGVMSHPDWMRIVRGVHGLRSNPGIQVQPQLLILGPVPRPGCAWLHMRLDVIGPHFLLQQVYMEPPPLCTYSYGPASVFDPQKIADDPQATEGVRNWSTASVSYDGRLAVDPEIDCAYRDARSARFEYGESG